MTGWRDYAGIALVALAVIVGIAVAAGAYQLAPPAATPVSTVGRAVTPEPREFIAALLGDREAGRVAFRATCQDCHIQGRQSIDPAARGRVELMSTRIRQGSGEMPAFGTDPNVMCYLDDIYAYLKARSDGAVGRGRPAKHADKPPEAAEAEDACMGG